MDDLTERLEEGGDVKVSKVVGAIENVSKSVESSNERVLLFLLIQ